MSAKAIEDEDFYRNDIRIGGFINFKMPKMLTMPKINNNKTMTYIIFIAPCVVLILSLCIYAVAHGSSRKSPKSHNASTNEISQPRIADELQEKQMHRIKIVSNVPEVDPEDNSIWYSLIDANTLTKPKVSVKKTRESPVEPKTGDDVIHTISCNEKDGCIHNKKYPDDASINIQIITHHSNQSNKVQSKPQVVHDHEHERVRKDEIESDKDKKHHEAKDLKTIKDDTVVIDGIINDLKSHKGKDEGKIEILKEKIDEVESLAEKVDHKQEPHEKHKKEMLNLIRNLKLSENSDDEAKRVQKIEELVDEIDKQHWDEVGIQRKLDEALGNSKDGAIIDEKVHRVEKVHHDTETLHKEETPQTINIDNGIKVETDTMHKAEGHSPPKMSHAEEDHKIESQNVKSNNKTSSKDIEHTNENDKDKNKENVDKNKKPMIFSDALVRYASHHNTPPPQKHEQVYIEHQNLPPFPFYASEISRDEADDAIIVYHPLDAKEQIMHFPRSQRLYANNDHKSNSQQQNHNFQQHQEKPKEIQVDYSILDLDNGVKNLEHEQGLEIVAETYGKEPGDHAKIKISKENSPKKREIKGVTENVLSPEYLEAIIRKEHESKEEEREYENQHRVREHSFSFENIL